MNSLNLAKTSSVLLALLLAGACADDDASPGDGGACACSQSGLYACVDTKSIRTCDGCTWKTHTCDDLCKANKGSGWAADPQKGCQADTSSGKDVCWCKEKFVKTKCNLTWTFTDRCDNGQAPGLEFHDLQEKVLWGPYSLSKYNTPLKTTLSCKCGSKICYGAWQGTTYWGCAKGCQKACTNCCTTCRDGTETTDLNC